VLGYRRFTCGKFVNSGGDSGGGRPDRDYLCFVRQIHFWDGGECTASFDRRCREDSNNRFEHFRKGTERNSQYNL
jgi:hypothetical protein